MNELNLIQNYSLSGSGKNALCKIINCDILKLKFDFLNYIYDSNYSKCRLFGHGNIEIIIDHINASNCVEYVSVFKMFYPSFAYVGHKEINIQVFEERLSIEEWKKNTNGNLVMLNKSSLLKVTEVLEEQEYNEFDLNSANSLNQFMIDKDEVEIPRELFNLSIKHSIHRYLILYFKDQVLIIEKLDNPKTFEIHFNAKYLLDEISKEIDDDTGKLRYSFVNITKV